MDPYEFDRDECKWGKKLGKGNFGEVFEVEYHGKKFCWQINTKNEIDD
mgnify:CR=1 FL=1